MLDYRLRELLDRITPAEANHSEEDNDDLVEMK